MKRFMLNTFLLSLAVAFTGCGGSSDDPQPAAVSITVSQESITAPADGGTYTINVSTTGKEWGAYADQDFISLETACSLLDNDLRLQNYTKIMEYT
jgi:hypothetical protein